MIIVISILFILILSSKIFFSIKKNLSLKYLLTPLTTLTLILLPLLSLYRNSNLYSVIIAFALICSLIGDIFNMFEDNTDFYLPFGIIFFVMAHIAYIFNFMKGYSFSSYQIFIILFVLSIMITTSIIFKFSSIIHKIIVGLYMFVVSATMIIAIGNLNKAFSARAVLISAGAVLFWLSDLMLGIHLFWKNMKFQSLYVWGLYAPAQFLIALSCFY
jgi:uncharacterized membrane protein YhhN